MLAGFRPEEVAVVSRSTRSTPFVTLFNARSCLCCLIIPISRCSHTAFHTCILQVRAILDSAGGQAIKVSVRSVKLYIELKSVGLCKRFYTSVLRLLLGSTLHHPTINTIHHCHVHIVHTTLHTYCSHFPGAGAPLHRRDAPRSPRRGGVGGRGGLGPASASGLGSGQRLGGSENGVVHGAEVRGAAATWDDINLNVCAVESGVWCASYTMNYQ